MSNTRLKLAKNQANAKQHPEAELLLFENYSLSSSIFSFKKKKKFVCIHNIILLIIMKMKQQKENRKIWYYNTGNIDHFSYRQIFLKNTVLKVFFICLQNKTKKVEW